MSQEDKADSRYYLLDYRKSYRYKYRMLQLNHKFYSKLMGKVDKQKKYQHRFRKGNSANRLHYIQTSKRDTEDHSKQFNKDTFQFDKKDNDLQMSHHKLYKEYYKLYTVLKPI